MSGSFRCFVAICSTHDGVVAEKRAVWRLRGVAAMIRSTSGAKPRSSISSASSSTSMLQVLQAEVPPLDVVEHPAGGPDDHLGAVRERLLLRYVTDAAVEERHLDAGCPADLRQDIAHLAR